MTTLSYKDFQGSVKFEDGKLVIQVLHIDDILLTECHSVSELQPAFEELVDDYLETCAELGQKPSKPFKGSFNVRITPELHRRAAMAAASADETLNAWVAASIEQRLDKERGNGVQVVVRQIVAAASARVCRRSSTAWHPIQPPSDESPVVPQSKAEVFNLDDWHRLRSFGGR